MKRHLTIFFLISFGWLAHPSGLSILPAEQPCYITRTLWRPGSNEIALTFYESSDIEIIDANTLATLFTLKSPSLVAPALGVSDLKWSPDGRFLASAFEDNVLHIWDLSESVIKPPLVIEHRGHFPRLSWNPDSDKLATAWAGRDEPRLILIWDTYTGDLLAHRENPFDQMESRNEFHWVLWSPDGKYLASANNSGQIILWDGSTYIPIIAFLNVYSTNSRFVLGTWSPDSSKFASVNCAASSGNGSCHLWFLEVNTLRTTELFYKEGQDSFFSAPLSWSPNGRFLAVSNYAVQAVQVWDTITHTWVAMIKASENEVSSISWSPDSNWLAFTDGELHIVNIWQAMDTF